MGRRSIRRTLAASLLVLLLPIGASAAPAPGDQARGSRPPRAEFVDGTVLVGFEAGASGEAVTGALARAGARVDRKLGGGAQVLHVAPGRVQAAIAQLKRDPAVRYAEPDYIYRITDLPNDPSFGQLWGLDNTGQTVDGVTGTAGADIDAETAWQTTTGAAQVVVGVVDTGIAYTHADLAANVWSNPGGIGGCAAGTHGYDSVAGDCDPLDDHDHGSHVSGTIGALGDNGTGVAGVNWTTRLMGLKAFNAAGSTTSSSILGALNFAIQAKQAGVNLRVLNNSWGGFEFSQATLDAIRLAGQNDILFVAAAGNYGFPNDIFPFYPCGYASDNIICVGASTQTDGWASFSNYGTSSVDLAAPGVNILSTVKNGGYAYFDGTSMATPHVSGAAALVLAAGDRPTAELKSAILDTVDLLPAMTSRTVTGGRLDVGAAVTPASPLPRAPSLSATTEPGVVHLAWNVPHEGASPITAYRIYRGSPGNLGLLAEVGAPAYDDTAVVNGTSYTYQVSAVNGDGEGPRSSEVTVVPPLPPSAPDVPVLTAMPGNGTVHVCWTTPADGGSPITGYRLFRGPQGGALGDLAAAGVTNRHDDTTAVDETAYDYQVSAVNAIGEGAPSAIASATPRETGTGPTIDGFAPSVAGAGASVQISGSNFAMGACPNEVVFGAKSGTVTASAADALTATVPASGGWGRLTVTTPAGTATSTNDLYVAPAPATAADVAHTTRMTTGQSRDVTLATAGKIGLVLFEGTAGQSVSLNVTNSTISASRVAIRAPDGSEVVPSRRAAKTTWFEPMTLPASGTYLVSVDPENAYTGTLRLNLYDVPPDATGTISPGGPAAIVTIGTPGQDAALSFAGSTGQRVSLRVTGSTITASRVSILTPDGAQLGTDRATSSGWIDVLALPVTGSYRITIDPENYHMGSMTITLYDVPPDVSLTAAPTDTPIGIAITTPGQNAAVSFAGSAGQRISLNVTNSTVSATGVKLLSPSGSVLATKRASPNGFIDVLTLATSGTYRVTLDPENQHAGSLTLTIHAVPPDPVIALTAGTPTTVTVTTPGQNAAATFAGTAGGSLSLVISAVSISQTDVSVLKPDGTTLVSNTLVTTSGKTITASLPVTGTYRIVMNPRTTFTGSMTLRI